MSTPPEDFFNQEMANAYDERNRNLSPIKDALIFTISLILKELPKNSKILCVGVGTGTEIISLAEIYSNWSFVALDPSKSMLDVCQTRIREAGLWKRCEFVHGYIEDIPVEEDFDAVISLFVGHFVEPEKRMNYFENMVRRLRQGGHLVHSEISYDLESKKFPIMLKKWEEVQKLMGATPESLQKLPKQLKETLTVLPPEKTQEQIRHSGIKTPVRFFQSLMICAWFGQK